jgi:hypothetical protein
MVPRTILRQLARLRRRERLLALAWGVTRGLAIGILVLAVACLVDWFIDRRRDTPLTLRWAMLLAQIALWGFLLVAYLFRPLSRRMSDSRLSLWVEDKALGLKHRLISAVQLNRPGAATAGMSPELIAAVTREAERETVALDFRGIADHRRLKWSALVAAPLALAIAIILVCWPTTVQPLLARQFLAERDIPRSVYLESVSRELVWPSGEEVLLRFRATGASLTDQLHGEVRIDPDGQASERYPLIAETLSSSAEASFVARVPAALNDFTYLAWLKDGRTRQPSRVHFEPRPALVEQRAWVLLPHYYGLRPNGQPYEVEQPRGDIVAVPQASARVAVKLQKPVTQAVVEILGQPDGSAPSASTEAVLRRLTMRLEEGGASAACTFDPQSNETAYRILIQDQYGFENATPPRRTIRILPEEAPHVALLPERFAVSGDSGPTEDFEVEGVPVPLGGAIRIAYACSAAAGLSRAQLRFRVNEGPWRPLPLAEVAASAQTGPFDPRQGAFEKSSPAEQIEFHAVPATDLEQSPGRNEGGGRFDFQTRSIPDVQVGDKIEFYVEVFDHNPDPERPPGRSESRVKAVVTPAELEAWVRQTLQEESRIRKLEGNQRDVFAQAGFNDDDTAMSPRVGNTPDLAAANPPAPGPIGSTFVRDWQLVGPFPSEGDRGHDELYLPESEPVNLGQEYDGIRGKIRWRFHHSDTDKIDLERFFAHGEAGVAYAVCWVRAPAKRAAVLATGSDDGIKVWLNRKLTLDRHVHREAIPGEDQRRIELAAGWNEILVKVDNDFGTWAFYLELRSGNSGRPLRDIEFRTTPPDGELPKPAIARFLHDWQLLGPFRDSAGGGHATAHPPEREKVSLAREYDGAQGRIRWRLHHTDKDLIDLAGFFNYREPASAYAVCWVHTERQRPVVLSVGSDDGIKIWINRKLVLDHAIARQALPGQDLVNTELAAGWNELLLKIDNISAEWGFYCELRDASNGQPLRDVRFQMAPPPGGAAAPRADSKLFLRDWQLLGPFASQGADGHGKEYPPEKDKFKAGKEYDGAKGKIHWRLHHSDADYIDLSRFFVHRQAGVAYAVCWVRSDMQKPVWLKIGSKDGIKIWINRKLAFAHKTSRRAEPGQDETRATLQQGWNEILVKVDNIDKDWGFFLELRDASTNTALSGVEIRTAPP